MRRNRNCDVPDPPRTIKGLLRAAGIPLGGSIRARISQHIDDALFGLWEKACEQSGGEFAAILLASLLTFDPQYKPSPWLAYRLKAHEAAIREAIQNGQVRACRNALDDHRNWPSEGLEDGC